MHLRTQPQWLIRCIRDWEHVLAIDQAELCSSHNDTLNRLIMSI
jgi:hypothetical protein